MLLSLVMLPKEKKVRKGSINMDRIFFLTDHQKEYELFCVKVSSYFQSRLFLRRCPVAFHGEDEEEEEDVGGGHRTFFWGGGMGVSRVRQEMSWVARHPPP